jgi:NAD(P)-dependent dehydrogenase (short-subunit alcohol dehydrogenase family)
MTVPVHPAAAARFDLTGQVAWTVGGAGLLGSRVSRALAEHGATVVVADAMPERAEEVAAAQRGDGLPVSGRRLDIGDAESVERQADAIVAEHGRLDICVNLAAMHTGLGYDDLTADALHRGLSVNLVGAFLLGRAAGRAMSDGGGGRIIHFGSMYGSVSPDPGAYPEGVPVNPPDYGFAKAGILQLVRYQAVRLAPHGVLVNAVAPGPFPNPAGQGGHPEFVRRLAARVPLGRVGLAEEIVGSVIYLASPASSFVTGTCLAVDGGWTAW